MKNKEKFEKEIVELCINSDFISVNKKLKVIPCDSNNCNNCIFIHGNGSCSDKRKQWAEAEYVEPKVFTEEEKEFIRSCDKIKWLARDKEGNLYGYSDKPLKKEDFWDCENFFFDISLITKLSFSLIKWEDEEPTIREEILR